jgi:hypothetical protein
MRRASSTRLLLTIPFAIPAYWTPEQALAIFEFLDDLRDAVWNHYRMQIFEESRQQCAPTTTDHSNDVSDDLNDPF